MLRTLSEHNGLNICMYHCSGKGYNILRCLNCFVICLSDYFMHFTVAKMTIVIIVTVKRRQDTSEHI